MQPINYKHCISYGFNCEVAFALQHMGIFESTIFSWADIRGTEALINGMIEFENILTGALFPYGGNMLFCERTNIGFHGRIKFDKSTLTGKTINSEVEQSILELKSRLAHLAGKEAKIFADGPVLVVFKHFADIFAEKYSPIESSQLVAEALQNKYNTENFHILCVTESAENFSHFDSERLKFRSLPRFSPRSSAFDIDKQAWEKLLGEFGFQYSGASANKEAHLKKAADFWSTPRGVAGTRWWTNPRIIRHVNKLICGKPLEGLSAGIHERLRELSKETPFNRGISVGVGGGEKELELVKQGIVKHFDLYGISEARVEKGRLLAEKLGLQDSVNFYVEDALEVDFSGKYDLVYWDSALHHMLDANKAIQWSKNCLRMGGVFFMHDFVGPSRFQWTDYQLKIASQVRQFLPDRFLVHPKTLRKLSKAITRPSIDAIISDDPTEAADSSEILSALAANFPEPEVVFTGGVIYHSALNDVMGNFNEEADAILLDSLLLLDEVLASKGETHFAVAVARNFPARNLKPTAA